MFSGIVEEYGKFVAIEKDQENYHLTLTCSFVDEFKNGNIIIAIY